MRVHIYKGSVREVSLLFEPAPGRHKIPVMVSRLPREKVRERAAKEVAEMRGEKPPTPA